VQHLYDRGANTFTFVGARQTRGVFQTNGWGEVNSDRTSEDAEDGLARNVAESEGPIFPDLRSPLDVRDPPKRGWCGG
jgi:hypothetical protein